MNYAQVKNYLEGKSPESESDEIRSWLKDQANADESRQILGEIWMNSELKFSGEIPDFDGMLQTLHEQIGENRVMKNTGKPKSGIMKRLFREFSKVAAILFFPLVLLAVYFYFRPVEENVPFASNSVREIYTKPGTRTKIELSDGTNVWLNDGTTFRYPEHFEGSTRQVFVDGEAYFEVHSNPEKPFVVDNPMMKTVVTGTHFNLNAYSADHFFEATLLEGKVHLERSNQSLTLKPGEQVQFDAAKQEIVKKDVDAENAKAWIDGKLIFKDERLSTVVKRLGRWYNVEIVLSDPKMGDYVLSGTIENEKLDQTLNLISLAIPVKFEYKKEANPTEIQRTIYLMKK